MEPLLTGWKAMQHLLQLSSLRTYNLSISPLLALEPAFKTWMPRYRGSTITLHLF